MASRVDPLEAPLRIGIVGAGAIGASHIEAIAAVDGVQLAAIVDPDDAAADVGRRHAVPWFRDHEDPELTSLIDAAIISAPPNVHAEIGDHLIGCQKHVLCEKPLALSPAEARSLVAAARRGNCTLMMASKFRYVEDVVRAREILESGRLGEIESYENAFLGRVNMEGRWNAVREISGGGVIMDNGPHVADVARFLLGPIEAVHAVADPPQQDLDVEDSARLQFKSTTGCKGAVELSWSSDAQSSHFVTVHGTEGTLRLGWKGSGYRMSGSDEWIDFGSGYAKIDALSAQLADFADVVQRGTKPHIRVEDALASVDFVEAAYKSLERGAWCAVGSKE